LLLCDVHTTPTGVEFVQPPPVGMEQSKGHVYWTIRPVYEVYN
jgi:hypothetical protein